MESSNNLQNNFVDILVFIVQLIFLLVFFLYILVYTIKNFYKIVFYWIFNVFYCFLLIIKYGLVLYFYYNSQDSNNYATFNFSEKEKNLYYKSNYLDIRNKALTSVNDDQKIF